ncbi:MAG: type II secretion system major pseudopilin GspG [Deltaproteobacteria bacterium]|nr:type II secretion system major pseudopilin GspG [Deltaproteobacteria bacterium]
MRQRQLRSRARRGLTLIEILVVITILGVIAGIVGINVVGAGQEASHRATEVELHNLTEALHLFKLKTGRYPNTGEGLSPLVSPPSGQPILRKLPTDAWGNAYVYQYPGGPSPDGFILRSKGPDGEDGTADDLSAE